mgnify:CR=1 FL=1
MASHQHKLQHLFLRAGFGETPPAIARLKDTSLGSVVEQLFNDSKSWKDIHYLPYPIKENREKKGVSASQFLGMILKSKQDSEELNQQWLFKLTHTEAVLREKMVFFWHNHFATSVPFSYLMQEQNNTLRKHALGNFRDLLFAIAKDPAMILYLNNQENKKDHPNENFAREVMELFTLGIGHYTEKDIQEAARAFTGWTIDARGEFVFREGIHDSGEKIFLGKKGNFKGEDILNILLDNKQTARYIVYKIYREFVNPKPDTEIIEQLAAQFFNSGYNIEQLMRSIFNAEWFYADQNIGVKIASPVELIVRYNKLIKLKFTKPKGLLQLQHALGQVLFFPPNVAGWKGHEKWIDSASLLLRLNLPQFIVNGSAVGLKSRPAFEEAPEDGPAEIKNQKVESDWGSFIHFFRDKKGDVLIESMLSHLIQSSAARIPVEKLRSVNSENTDNQIVQLAAQIMSLPEFQLI